jgi:long-chain acyl-CoA synthetase
VNLYPAEAEAALARHPAVADVAVIGVPDADLGEALHALVVVAPSPEASPTPAELDAFCRGRLAGPKCPRSYEIVDTVGRNAMGKLDKRALRRPYWPTDRTIGG